ncbi:MAG: hypothetical protein GWN37_14395 [Gammaproteobacteria bacterium]|nr:hypothetical protein [Gammaproteobacteria bacterium]
MSGLGFVFNAALLGGLAMALYVPLMLWINHTQLPRSARPGVLNVIVVAIAAIVYGGFAVYSLWALFFG